MSRLSRIYTARLLSLFLALYILNFSIGTSIPTSAFVSTLAQNTDIDQDSDSMLELILGVHFELENPMAEGKEAEPEVENELEFPDFFSSESTTNALNSLLLLASQVFSSLVPNTISLLQEVCSPPPKF